MLSVLIGKRRLREKRAAVFCPITPGGILKTALGGDTEVIVEASMDKNKAK